MVWVKPSIAREYAAHYGSDSLIAWISSETKIAMGTALYQCLLQLKPEDVVAQNHIKNKLLSI